MSAARDWYQKVLRLRANNAISDLILLDAAAPSSPRRASRGR